MEVLKEIIERALDPKNSVELTIEMPSHDAVFQEIAESLNNQPHDRDKA